MFSPHAPIVTYRNSFQSSFFPSGVTPVEAYIVDGFIDLPAQISVSWVGWMYELLPSAFKLQDRIASGGYDATGVVEKIIGCAEADINYTVSAIEALLTLSDPFECPLEYLPFLADITSAKLDSSASEARQREQLHANMYLLKQKGTHPGFQNVAANNGLDVSLVELWKTQVYEIDDYAEEYAAGYPYKSARVSLDYSGLSVSDQASLILSLGWLPVNVLPYRVTLDMSESDAANKASESISWEATYEKDDPADDATEDDSGVPKTMTCLQSCEVNCQSACEYGGCELYCESYCEEHCQTTCEYSCEDSSCQTSCEAGCQADCQTVCQEGYCQEASEI